VTRWLIVRYVVVGAYVGLATAAGFVWYFLLSPVRCLIRIFPDVNGSMLWCAVCSAEPFLPCTRLCRRCCQQNLHCLMHSVQKDPIQQGSWGQYRVCEPKLQRLIQQQRPCD